MAGRHHGVALQFSAHRVSRGVVRPGDGGLVRPPASADWPAGRGRLWPAGRGDRGRTRGTLCAGARLSAGSALSAARRRERHPAECLSGSGGTVYEGVSLTAAATRDAGAPPARTAVADHFGPGFGRRQGPSSPGSGPYLHPGARAVSAGRGNPAALLGAAGTAEVLSRPGGVAEGP